MSSQKRPKILIVDDEVGIRELLTEILTDEGYAVSTAENADAAWEIRRNEQLSLILLDIWMPGKDGLTLLKQWRDAGLANVPVVVMSGHATIDTAVEATKLGAREILEKPIAANRLLVTLQKVVSSSESEQVSPEIQHTDFGRTDVMKRFKTQMLEASANTNPTLMVGPASAGASFYAQMLTPPQRETVFIDRSAELESGTSEIMRKADGGLVIIRMIDMLTPAQQSGLLALVGEAQRNETRIVAAAMENPEVLKADKGFNAALLEAFSRHVIYQPSLSQYMADIPYAVDIIIRRLTHNTEMQGRTLTPQAVDLLLHHNYENDFLELISLVRSSLMYSNTPRVDAPAMQVVLNQFALGMSSISKMVGGDIFAMPLRDARLVFEREYFRRLMEITQGNIQQATEMSGLDRTYLYRKIKQYKPD